MRIAAALSEHPLATQAVGEVVGQVLEELGTPPDLAVLVVSRSHGGAMEDIARVVRRVANPRVLVGSVASGVLGGAQEVEDGPAIALWAARFDVDIEPVRLEATPSGAELVVAGGAPLRTNSGTMLLVSDPFSFPMDQVVAHLRDTAPGVRLIGGFASAGFGPGGNTLVLDDERFTTGAVGVWLPEEIDVVPAIAQGCRPIGDPFVVTKAERNVIYEIGGQPAVSRVNDLIEGLSDADKRLLANGLHLGRVIDERRFDHGRGDFLVRSLLGADRSVGAIAVSDEFPVGTTVQFQVHDAAAAHEDLEQTVASALHGSRARGSLAFTCTSRGASLFGAPSHDAALLSELTAAPLAGMFCTGEVGPVAGRNFVHNHTAAVAIFGVRAASRAF